MPTSPDHVFSFLDDDPTLDTEEDPEEDQDMDIDEEDPKEDQEIDFTDEDDEWEDEEDWLMAPVTPPTPTSLVRLVRPATPPSPLSTHYNNRGFPHQHFGAFPSDMSLGKTIPIEMSLGNSHWGILVRDTIPSDNPQRRLTHAPLPVDSISLPNYQTTTSVTTPWIPPTLRRFQHERDHVHNTFEVRGPSLAAPDALHPIRCSIFMVASRVAFHHQELEALHVRLDRFESIQTGLRRLERKIKRDIKWLGELTVTGWRARVGCARCCSDRGYRAATLRAALEDTRAEVLDLRTRLSASERSKMSLITRPSSDLDAGSCTRAREVMIFCTIKGKPLALPWRRIPRLDSGVRVSNVLRTDRLIGGSADGSSTSGSADGSSTSGSADRSSTSGSADGSLEMVESFCNSYYIPDEVHPTAPGRDRTITQFPEGKVGVYTRLFDYCGYRIPLTKFFVSILKYFRIHISQLSPFGAARISHFEVLTRVLDLGPSVAVFRAFYTRMYSDGLFSFAKRSLSAPSCLSKPPDSIKNWADHFFWVDSRVFPISVPLYTGGVLEKDPAPHLTARQEQAVQVLSSNKAPFRRYPECFLALVGLSPYYPFGENTYPAFEGPDRTGG
ncbi:hypothetical protein Tco_0944117 [Tanacetum coccineum]